MGRPDGLDLAGVCDRLAELPLLFQPGTEWNYSMGIDVLGRVVEVIAGVPLDDFVQEHVLDPLGMTDTVWHVPADQPTASPRCTSRHPASARRCASTPWAPPR